MFKVVLKNKKEFTCSAVKSIFESAKEQGVYLDHSCLTARCRSCSARIIEGETKNINEELVLTDEERANGFVLTCNTLPTSNLVLDIEDLGNITLYEKKIFPSKIKALEHLTSDVIKVSLRLPPSVNFEFNAGQYVNLIKNNIKRSYSLANYSTNTLEFFIKNYKGGEMSNYWFNEAKPNDLIRVEGPLGSFFLRDSDKTNIVLLGTGTGVAPIKSILDELNHSPEKIKRKTIYVFTGARFLNDTFWKPNYASLDLKFIQCLSREIVSFNGFKGYVQDAVLSEKIQLGNSQVYACGSSDMINSSKKVFLENGLEEHNFFSDAFVQSN